MKLVAKKPCRFGGKQYFIGQEVPAEAIVSTKKFIDNGTLEVSTSSEMEQVVETVVEIEETIDVFVEESEEVPAEAPKKTSKRSKKSGDAE